MFIIEFLWSHTKTRNTEQFKFVSIFFYNFQGTDLFVKESHSSTSNNYKCTLYKHVERGITYFCQI